MVIALIGATGLVGEMMIRILEEQQIPFTKFIPCASERSVGKEITVQGKPCKVQSVEDAIKAKPNLAIFSAGAATARKYAAAFAETGAYVIDNSSAFRGMEEVPLVVPEVNAGRITQSTRIISNPNCSTIQMVLPISPIYHEYGIKRLVISTYQSVTGTGINAVRQLFNEREGKSGEMAYPHPIDLNCFPHGGDFDEHGDSAEELKLVNETRKILDAPGIQITATVVRIPVMGGHSEAVNIETEKPFRPEDVRNLLENTPGVVVQDNPQNSIYPMPKYAEGRDEVFVGRIRRDHSLDNGINLWIVADNLRKGAATNAIQIARYLIDKQWL